MNVLIANDDGPDAYGLEVLCRAVTAVYPNARVVRLTQKQGQGGQGMAITPMAAEELPLEEIAPDVYLCDGTPADLMYVGLGTPERFLPKGQFDLVVTGVNHGHNVGMDVFHSGTVGMAMLASAFFGVTAVAFSQQVEYGATDLSDPEMFQTATECLPSVLRDIGRDGVRCRNVNFPLGRPIGQRVCGVSMFSRFRPHLAADNRREHEDVAELENGYITVSFLRPSALAERGGTDQSSGVVAQRFEPDGIRTSSLNS
jgi:5'-nucleotidase